jgi:hypothetical protein
MLFLVCSAKISGTKGRFGGTVLHQASRGHILKIKTT